MVVAGNGVAGEAARAVTTGCQRLCLLSLALSRSVSLYHGGWGQGTGSSSKAPPPSSVVSFAENRRGFGALYIHFLILFRCFGQLFGQLKLLVKSRPSCSKIKSIR